MTYINGLWTIVWLGIGVVFFIAGKLQPKLNSPLVYSITFSGLFFSIEFILIWSLEILMGKDFLVSITDDNQPIIFFSLAFFSLSYVIAFRFFYKNLFNANTFSPHFLWVWLALSLPELSVKFLSPITEFGDFLVFIGYPILFLIYNFGIVYFLEKSLPNSKFGMFAAVLKLILDIWFTGVLGNKFDMNEVLLNFVYLALLIQGLVILHRKKVKESLKVDAN